MNDRWTTRDLPVLRQLVDHDEAGRLPIRASQVADELDMDPTQVRRAVTLLEQDGYLRVPTNSPWVSAKRGEFVLAVTPDALRAVDLWPTPQNALDRMIDALEAIAENTDDADDRGKAQKFAAWLRASGTTVGLSVASAAITGQLPR